MKLIKLSASWCGPCKSLSKVISGLELEIPMEEIDIDEKPEEAQKYGIRGVPTLVLLDDTGEVLKKKSGMMNSSELQSWLNS
jgi:thioredoxin-like negative regulator of GroEL